jgi:hypothetical protein
VEVERSTNRQEETMTTYSDRTRDVRRGDHTIYRCERHPASCLHQLAAGDIPLPDLCGPCTARFMFVLDRANGSLLPWHQNYRDRAGQA